MENFLREIESVVVNFGVSLIIPCERGRRYLVILPSSQAKLEYPSLFPKVGGMNTSKEAGSRAAEVGRARGVNCCTGNKTTLLAMVGKESCVVPGRLDLGHVGGSWLRYLLNQV